MSDSVLNNMLRAAASTPSTARLNVPQPAKRELRAAEDSFSRALERRMTSGEQSADAARERAAQAAREPQRHGQPIRERSERGADGKAREPNSAAADRSANADAAGNARPSAKARAPHEAGEAGDGASPSARAVTPDPASQADAPPHAAADAAAASDPAAAASLAAPLPQVVALPPALPLGDGDTLPLDDGPIETNAGNAGSSLLEKLIAEAAARTAPGDGGRGSPGAGDDPVVTRGAQSKTGADQIVAATVATSAPAPATTGAADTPAAALQSLQPDAQSGVHAARFAAVGRVEQSPLPQLPVATPAGQPAWAEDVGGRLVWMVGRHESKAEFMLTPPSLGKLEVTIHVGGDQTTAHFVAASAAARDALEQAMPRLREVLQQAGINLGEANVSTSGEQQAQQHAPGRQPGSRTANAGDAGIEAGRGAPTAGGMRAGRGIVDTFA